MTLSIEPVAPGIERVQPIRQDLGPVANSYIAHGWLVEPCVPDQKQAQGWLEYLSEHPVCGILLTHWHSDHFTGARMLAGNLTCPVYGPPLGQRHDVRGAWKFPRFETILPGDHVGPWEIIATPGHAETHVCFFDGETLITGDMIERDADVLIPPIERGGNLVDYRASLSRLADLRATRALPGHGPVIEQPSALMVERRSRS